LQSLAAVDETRSVRGRYDVGRAGLALLAALIAAAATYAAVVDVTLYSREFVVAVVAFDLLLTAGFALWPSGRHWSMRRRWLAAAFAIAAFLVALPSALFAIVVAGCACPGGGHVVPPLLGIGHRYWILLALLSVPALMFFAALLPHRRGRTHDLPGA
jgi:hypothetical protein